MEQDMKYNHSANIDSLKMMTHIMPFAVIALLYYMYSGGGRDTTSLNQAPAWDPAGNVPFSEWLQELQAWLNVTSGRIQPPAQAAAIQLGMRGLARRFALTIPPVAITYGAVLNGD